MRNIPLGLLIGAAEATAKSARRLMVNCIMSLTKGAELNEQRSIESVRWRLRLYARSNAEPEQRQSVLPATVHLP